MKERKAGGGGAGGDTSAAANTSAAAKKGKAGEDGGDDDDDWGTGGGGGKKGKKGGAGAKGGSKAAAGGKAASGKAGSAAAFSSGDAAGGPWAGEMSARVAGVVLKAHPDLKEVRSFPLLFLSGPSSSTAVPATASPWLPSVSMEAVCFPVNLESDCLLVSLQRLACPCIHAPPTRFRSQDSSMRWPSS